MIRIKTNEEKHLMQKIEFAAIMYIIVYTVPRNF